MLENLLLMISSYNPDANLDLVIKAFNYGERAHENQYRKSGEKYFVHPIEVAKILAELEMDESTIAAGLLHDVIEDTGITYEQMAKDFNTEIADLVDGVTKLGKLDYKSKEETQAENLRKMFMAMGKDIRVILIKLADRLHNMRTLKYMNEEKAKEKALETVEIFAPIAHRLGISKIKCEMEDIALRYIDPSGYYDLVEKVSTKKMEREHFIKVLVNELGEKLKEVKIDKVDISGRAKHFYSIYKKMKNQNKIFDEIYDLMAVRIIVDNVRDCYGALGVVHTIWKPMPGRFKDYIAMPKPNMYQSIHTTVIGNDGVPFEIQIRTWDMHKIAEFGIAAHWKYKEDRPDSHEKNMEEKLTWLRQMMEWQKDVSDSKEFMDSVKLDLFADEVFVFTPKGEVVELTAGSTPLDFAYKVHTGVGNRCVGAKVDGKIVTLDYQLNNGNIVEILTSSNSAGPSRDWINIVKSSHARNKIRQWFKKERREENIEKGRELLEKETKRHGFPLSEFLKVKYLNPILKPLSQNSIEDLYAALGYGGLTMGQVFPRIKEKYDVDHKNIAKEEKHEKVDESKVQNKSKNKSTGDSGVSVKGIDNIFMRFAKCCNPLPGDEIVGYITKGRGVSVHRRDCSQINLEDNEKIVEVVWDSEDLSKKNFEVEIQVDADDRRGLFMDVSKLFSDEKIFVNGINARATKDGNAVMNILIEVSSKEQLKSIKNKIKRIEGVVDAFRV
ncbi:MAG: RelA/SpoT family protein [Filifactoraceae bacterium]